MRSEPSGRSRALLAAGVLLGLALCALNRPLFLALNGAGHPVLDWLMLSLTHFGNGVVAALLALLLVPFRRDLTVRAALAMLVAGVLTALVKDVVTMPRPPAVLGDAVRVLGPKLTMGSLPSGHTGTAFALACSLRGHLRERVYYGVLAVAALVGLSRVYIGVHFPVDVVLGALLGWLSAEATRRPADRLIERLAGPRPYLDATLLGLAALSGVYLAFFEPMVRYNPWFLRPLGMGGTAAALFFLASTGLSRRARS
ncbi:MAG: phosphatase PAP2 family protein [bacterium]|nr:MAG: phosphatase PAP2 family protein [bacterium]